VLVMVILCFFGILAGSQALVHASSGLSSRALDLRRQRLSLDRALGVALGEGLLSVREGAVQGEAPFPGPAIIERLDELARGGCKSRLVETPSSLERVLWLPVRHQGALTTPSEELLACASPDLRALLSGRVEEHPKTVFRILSEHPDSPAGPLSWVTTWRAHGVSVPLSRLPLRLYDLPEEIGDEYEVLTPPSGFAAMGLVASREPFSRVGLQDEPGTQYYHFRRRASEASAYRRLFSQACVDGLAAAAGPGGIADLALPDDHQPAFAGLKRTPAGGTLDLATIGEREVCIVHSSSGGLTLKVNDSGGGERSPLVLLVMGAPEALMALEVGTIKRPLLLIALSCRLQLLPGSELAAAFFLGPDCEFLAENASIGHLSLHAGAPVEITGKVIGHETLPLSLEQLCPRAYHVAMERVSE